MIGYSLETRRRVARSSLMAPALTQAQRARLAPTIIVTPSRVVDERQRRYDDPTVFDLANLTPLQRWKRTHTEALIEPQRGGLVVRGDASMPAARYERLAAVNHKALPLSFQVRSVMELNEHTVAPCENHVMVPLGEQTLSVRELRDLFVSRRHTYFPQEKHVHEGPIRESRLAPRYEWTCRHCHQWGFEPYHPEDLARAAGVVWFACLKCSAPDFVASLSRRDFLKIGLGAGLGYAAWLSAFPSVVPVPVIPRAEAAVTYYVDITNGNDTTGNGSSANPWQHYDKARLNMVGGDTVLGRTGSANYKETFSFFNGTQFPDGTSWATATIIGADTGHTPTIQMPTVAPWTYIIAVGGSTKQYHVYQNLTIDMTNGGGSGVYTDGGIAFFTSQPYSLANAAHFLRAKHCTVKNYDAVQGGGQGGIIQGWADHCEVTGGCLVKDGGPPFGPYRSGSHGVYNNAGPDNLVETFEYFNSKGYGVHQYHSSGTVGDRAVVRRSRLHSGLGFNGIIIGTGTSTLVYDNLCYDNPFSGIRITGHFEAISTPTVFNNTCANNTGSGVAHETGVTGATYVNNIAVNNSPDWNPEAGSSAATQTTNSWQIGGFVASFVDQPNRNYHLAVGSSAIGAGTNQSTAMNSGTFPLATPIDYDGLTWVVPWGLGAYKRVAGGHSFIIGRSP